MSRLGSRPSQQEMDNSSNGKMGEAVARNEYLLDLVRIGDTIEVWWPMDKRYYRGVVQSKKSKGYHKIHYNDGDEEDLLLENEQWRLIGDAAQRIREIVTEFDLKPDTRRGDIKFHEKWSSLSEFKSRKRRRRKRI